MSDVGKESRRSRSGEMVTCCGCVGCCCGCFCICCLCNALRPLKATVCIIAFCILRYLFVNSDLYQQFTLEPSESPNPTASMDLYVESSVWQSVFQWFLVVTAVLLAPQQRRGAALARGGSWLLFLYGGAWAQGREWAGQEAWHWVRIAAQYLFLAKSWEDISSYRLPHLLSLPSYCLISSLYLYFPPDFPFSVWGLCCAMSLLCIRYICALFVYLCTACLASEVELNLSKAQMRPKSLTALYESSLSGVLALGLIAAIVVWLSLAPWLYELLDWEPPWVLGVVDPLVVGLGVWQPKREKWALAGEVVALGLSIEVWKALFALHPF